MPSGRKDPSSPSVALEVVSRGPVDDHLGRPPLLFVHGLAGAAWIWQEAWLDRAAEAGWPVQAVSLRGHGGSAGRGRRWKITIDDYARDVEQVASRLPEPPVLVAHSLGAVVVGRVIARRPVRAVVMLVPVGVTHGLGTLVHNVRRIPVQVVRMVAARPLRLTADDILNVLATHDPVRAQRYIARLEDEPPLPQYQLVFHLPPGPPVGHPPVLVYGAELDKLVPYGDADRTAAYYGTKVRMLSGTGHYVMLDAARDTVLDTVLADLTDALNVDTDQAGGRR